MRIIELEIQNVRGIKHLVLRPDGHSFAVTGPNGSGKSAVVDAVDFLLTGKIQRLTGKGTGGLSLKSHGPHVDTKATEARVRAVVQVAGSKRALEIGRSMSAADSLVFPEGADQLLQPVLELATRGQHVLSRREILKYITAEAKTRAEEIQSLLNLSDIDSTRSVLVKVQNILKADAKAAKQASDTAKTVLGAAAGLDRFREQDVLAIVNEKRAVLAGQPLAKLANLKAQLVAPPMSGSGEVNISLLEADVSRVRSIVRNDGDATARRVLASEMIQLISDLHADASVRLQINRVRLIELGLNSIEEVGSCPLCDRPWEPGELKDYLSAKLEAVKEAAKTVDRVNEIARSFSQSIVGTTATVDKLLETCRTVRKNELAILLERWRDRSEILKKCLADPLDDRNSQIISETDWAMLGFEVGVIPALQGMTEELKGKAPQPDPRLTAWEILIRIDERIGTWQDAEKAEAEASRAYDRAVGLLQAFEASRDAVLSELFATIKKRFVSLHRSLHKDDEDTFDAILQLDGAGLDFQVDFHGKGSHPPHALHSEGHQDSMGLCLYLALAEHLNSGVIDLVVLDDVVMSVDSGHRRELCKILREEFPSRQFVITTHERAWARQLQADGAIGREDLYTFYNWTVDNGPRVNTDGDMWKLVETKLADDDVPGAAHSLRYGLEWFFQHVCGALRASVKYNWQERWGLGDFLDASKGQFRSYLKRAKTGAQSWGRVDVVTAVEELESVFNQAVANSQTEQWAVNANVHYNNWANFSKEDFMPVVEAMQELCAQFRCHECGTTMEAQGVGQETTMVRCSCGKVSLNLTRKPATAN